MSGPRKADSGSEKQNQQRFTLSPPGKKTGDDSLEDKGFRKDSEQEKKSRRIIIPKIPRPGQLKLYLSRNDTQSGPGRRKAWALSSRGQGDWRKDSIIPDDWADQDMASPQRILMRDPCTPTGNCREWQ
ncbi:hypothetical protein LTR06_009093 [Exophiala xenobiotica]|nr:hypothetical protein LTR61_006682 [Exophiala xenobiotica]KAK5405395.1 hypothetical protein LTR06_009093 [Exophiala xenobiotica]